MRFPLDRGIAVWKDQDVSIEAITEMLIWTHSTAFRGQIS